MPQGNSAITALADLIEDKLALRTPRLLSLPSLPMMGACGAEGYFVSRRSGPLRRFADSIQTIAALPTFHSFFFFDLHLRQIAESLLRGEVCDERAHVPITVDCLTMIGCARFISSDWKAVNDDLRKFHELNDGLLILE